MPKPDDQPESTDEVKDDIAQDEDAVAAAAVEKEEKAAEDKATKTSEKFDERIDAEGVEGDEETPPAAEPGDDDKDKGDKDEPKPKGDEETPPEEKDESKETPAPDADKDTEVKVSKEVAERAIELGLTEEEIADFASDADATKTLNIIQNIVDDEEPPATPQGPDAQTPAEKPAVEAAKEDEGFKLTFEKEDDVDPEILANLQGMDKHYKGKVEALSNQVNELLDKLQEQDAGRFMGRFDGMIKELGKDFESEFGTGATKDLSRRGGAKKARIAVRTRIYAFAKGLHDAGENVPSEQQLFDMAVNTLHSKKMKNISGQRSQEASKTRRKQVIGKPAAGRKGDKTPLQKAYATSAKFDELIDTSED